MEPHARIPPSLAPSADAPLEAPAAAAPPVPRRSWWRRIRRALLWMFLALFLLALVPPGCVLWLRWYPPPTSSFMLRSEVKPVAYVWVPKQQIPETLRRAVVAAEDQKFWTHWGFDFIAIAEALEHNEKSKRKRGASTITQQTAKNLFLWPSRSWLRKGLEVSFTLLLEWLWPKERILEVYLNIAEFGPGVYGVEAAAQKFFRKPAAELSPAETAQLAAVLPNPRKWRADRPGPYVQSRVDWILTHIGHRPRFSTFPSPDEPLLPGTEGAEPAPGPLPEAPADEAPSNTDDLISDHLQDAEATPPANDEGMPTGAEQEPATTEPTEPPKEAPRY